MQPPSPVKETKQTKGAECVMSTVNTGTIPFYAWFDLSCIVLHLVLHITHHTTHSQLCLSNYAIGILENKLNLG